VLEAELRALTGHRNLLFGYMTLAVLASRPTRYPERPPRGACVTVMQQCQRDANMQKKAYTEGCFLGDLESKLVVPDKGRFFGSGSSRGLQSEGNHRSNLIGWWRGAARDCGFPEPGGSDTWAEANAGRHRDSRLRELQNATAPTFGNNRDAYSPASTLAPFPTGPLAVFGRDLATALFEDCAYLRHYERSAREWGRHTLCRGRRAHLSFASTLCDSVLSHWLARCNVDVTVAHTTRTKSHHYMWRGAGLGWMPPSNLSLAVHYLKAKASAPSGPNNTAGGEWSHVHDTLVTAAKRVGFPPLLYRLRRGYSLNVSSERFLMRSLNPDVFHWYSAECSFEHALLRAATAKRADAFTAAVRGPRPQGMSDAKYIGGHPPGWPFSGCNPSRFRPYPRWPPSLEVLQAIRGATAHHPGSERFTYFGHGPNASELAALLAGAKTLLSPVSLSAKTFTRALQQAIRPHQILQAGHILYALRKGSSSRTQHEQRKLFLAYVHARVSLEAFARSISEQRSGLRAEFATRDNTYYWKWT
jgi:hypothetical protein